MKLSFNSWVYCSFPFWLPSYTLEETVVRLARIGYDGIEVGAASPHAYPAYMDAKRRADVVDLLHAEGIVISSICPAAGGGPGYNPASPIEAERRAAVTYYKDCIAMAADLECRIVIWLSGWYVFGTSQQQAWEWTRTALRECARHAEEHEIILAVEPTPADSNLVETPGDALQLMREAESPNVKVMFDTAHAFYRNEPAADYVRQMGEDLVHVHITDRHRLPPGKGGTDFRALIKALRETGFDGFLTQETGFGSRDVDPDTVAMQGLEAVRALLATE